jgi:hypothetical protein
VSIIYLAKGPISGATLDRRQVTRISAYLVQGTLDHAPERLRANSDRAFIGSKIYSRGFIFDDAAARTGIESTLDQMNQLIANNPRNADRTFPYIGGLDIDHNTNQVHSRYVINFADMSEEFVRDRWPDLMDVVERKVKPDRLKLGNNSDG